MKFENTRVFGFENAIIGMRLPMCKDFPEAQDKCDSVTVNNEKIDFDNAVKTGEKDLDLMKRLIKADKNGSGQPNSKFLRMIHVQVAITAPLYWWKEADTYKIATVTNSTSTMHKLTTTPITIDCFEMEDFSDVRFDEDDCYGMLKTYWDSTIYMCVLLKQKFNETKDKRYWKELIRLLPESWLQTRMFDCNYATLRNIYRWRKNHKLVEWHKFCEWIESLPYSKELLTDGEVNF